MNCFYPVFSFLILLFFQVNSVYSQATVFLKAGGDILTPGDWGTSADGLSGTLSDFSQNNTYNFSSNNASRTLNGAWNITAGSTVILGDGTNAFSLTYSGAATMGATPANIQMNNNSVLVLNVNFNLDASKTTYNAGSRVIYSSGTTLLGTDQYMDLEIDETIATSGASVIVAGELQINAGEILSFNSSSSLTLNGSTDLSGTISGDNTGTLTVAGGNELCYLVFTSGFENIANLTIGSSSNLFSNLTVSNNFSLVSGYFGLNNSKLTLNGPIFFAPTYAADIRGSLTSSLTIGGSGSITNDLLMDFNPDSRRSFSELVMNRSGASLNLGSQTHIYGSITITNGTVNTNNLLHLKSTATQKGRVGPIGSGGTLSGDVRVEVLKPAGVTGWVNLCSAGVTGKAMSDWNTNFAITCPTCPDGSTVNNATFTSIYSYSEAATSNSANAAQHYIGIPNISTAIGANQGYWVYLGNSYPNSSEMVITLTGVVNTKNSPGNINLTVTGGASAENGWNLIANPYPSPIQVSSIESAGGANISEIVGYDPDTDSFITFSSAGSNTAIPMGQAFYVRAINAVNLTPDETWKSTSNNASIFKNSNQFTETGLNGKQYFFNDFLIDLQSSSTPKHFFTQAYFTFINGATFNYDSGLDAYSLESPIDPSTPRIFTMVNNEKLLRNALPVLSGSISIPLQVVTGYTGVYVLKPVNINKLPFGACVVLHDLLNNVNHDLRTGPYTTTISAGANNPQFELIITIIQASLASSQIDDPQCSNMASGRIRVLGSGSAPWNYTWRDQNDQIVRQEYNLASADTLQGLYPGLYKVEVNNAGTCNQASANFNLQALTPQPLAQFQTSQNNSSIFAWEPLHFTNISQNATSYSWDFGNGISAGTYHGSMTYAMPGIYTVKLNAYNDCGEESITQSQVQITANPLGLSESLSGLTNLYALNESGELIVHNASGLKGATLEVYNLLGQRLLSTQPISDEQQKTKINLQPSGIMLLLRFSNGQLSHTQRIVY